MDDVINVAPGDVQLSVGDTELLSRLQDSYDSVRQELAKVIVGQNEVIDQLLIAMLAGGHCLLEGVPGLAKTLMISTLARNIGDIHVCCLEYLDQHDAIVANTTNVVDRSPGICSRQRLVQTLAAREHDMTKTRHRFPHTGDVRYLIDMVDAKRP